MQYKQAKEHVRVKSRGEREIGKFKMHGNAMNMHKSSQNYKLHIFTHLLSVLLLSRLLFVLVRLQSLSDSFRADP